MKKLVNGVLMDMTAADLAQRKKDLAHVEELKQNKITKENNKTSGKAKLKSGEALTDAEIDALFG